MTTKPTTGEGAAALELSRPRGHHAPRQRRELRASARLPLAPLVGRSRRWLVENTFLPEWLPASWRHPASGFLIALALEGLAALGTLGLVQLLPAFAYPGTLELLMVAVIALTWGAGPALGATLCAVALLEYVVLPQRAMPHAGMAASLIEGALLLAIGVVMSLLASRTERVRRRAERARAEAQARERAAYEANRQMDAFLGIAGHELRHPLATMLTTIQLVERRLRRLCTQPIATPGELRENLEAIQVLLGRAEHQVALQDRLVGDLLDVSRIQAGRLEVRPRECDLAAIVAEAVEEQRLLWPARTIALEAPPTATVRADADRMGQVVTNYLTNALKYSPPDRPVSVTLTLKERDVCLAVRDEGPGLAPEEQRRVWERFHRAAGVRVLDGGGVGLGLGLHISRTIVERHSGQVGVRTAPGKGSTFWFTLPR